MGHRRYLLMDHPWRRNKKTFDGTQELECAPHVQSGEEILGQLEGMVFGDESVGMANKDKKKKKKKKKKRKKKKEEAEEGRNIYWKCNLKEEKYFFRLSYWKDNLLWHNLDVMHIEKNVMGNILGSILDIPGKTKDDLAARTDLMEMGLRHKLHPFTADNGRTYIPAACRTMSKDDKTHFLKVIRNVRVPDGYASNVSRCVRLKECTISGLKSHDSHILMEQLLPIVLRGSLPNNLVRPLVEMSAFFRGDMLYKLNTRGYGPTRG
jgi:hypothetical protein